jgi:hypothetical protein
MSSTLSSQDNRDGEPDNINYSIPSVKAQLASETQAASVRRELLSLDFPLSALPSNPETLKWMPEHTWSPLQDNLYAERCIPGLVYDAPRIDCAIRKSGKLWFVDWKTRRLFEISSAKSVISFN